MGKIPSNSLYAHFPRQLQKFPIMFFVFFKLLFTHQILRQILERPKTDYVQLEIKLERKKSRGDEWLYFWICRKKENQMEISSGAQRILYTTVCVRLVIVPPASYSSILCLKKKRKQTF